MSYLDYDGNRMLEGEWLDLIFFVFIVTMLLLQLSYGKA